MPQPISKGPLVITALFLDQQAPAEVAARYGVPRAWVYQLKARSEAEGENALEPRSRRPKTSQTTLLPETTRWHLEYHDEHRVARSAISRHCPGPAWSPPNRRRTRSPPTSASRRRCRT